MTDDIDLLTARETCALLRVSRSTLWRLTRDGKLRVTHITSRPYYSRADIAAFLATVRNAG